MNIKLARALFISALVSYMVWIGALVALAAVSGNRPGDRKAQATEAPIVSPSATDTSKD